MRHIFTLAIFCLAASCPAMALEDAPAPKPTATPGESPTTESALPAEPIFDCYATNSAWGYTLSGKLIDSAGTIWSYGRRGQAWLPALVQEQGKVYFKAAELQQKYTSTQTQRQYRHKHARGEIQRMIAAAAAGTLTRTDTGTRDAGSSSCHAYIHDAARALYRDVELGSDGGVSDMRIANSAAEAQQLLTWLKSVGVAK